MDYKPINTRDVFEGRHVQYKSEKDKNLSVIEYLEKVRPHLRYMINDLRKSSDSRMHHIVHIMYSKSDNSKFMISYDTNEIIQGHSDSLLERVSNRSGTIYEW